MLQHFHISLLTMPFNSATPKYHSLINNLQMIVLFLLVSVLQSEPYCLRDSNFRVEYFGSYIPYTKWHCQFRCSLKTFIYLKLSNQINI